MEDDGGLVAPPPAAPQVDAAPPPPPVDTSDVLGRYVNNITPAAPPPAVAPAATPEEIAVIDAAVAPAIAGAQELLAGGSAADIAAAEEAAGATPEVIQAILETGIPGTAGIIIDNTPELPEGMPQIAIAEDLNHDLQGEFDVLGFFPDFGGYETLSVNTLSGKAFIDYVVAGCRKRDLDPWAVFANAYNEGLGGGIGDHGTSYGPWQLHDHGALPKKYWNLGKNIAAIQQWAWSTAGIDYALDCMAKTSAVGKTGRDAVYALVYEFEQPGPTKTDEAIAYQTRLRTYGQLAGMGAGAWSWLAPFAHGPAKSSATTPAPVAPAPKPAKIIGTWRDLLSVLRDDIPAAGTHMQNTARRLKGAVT